jgi:hypothetical protein
MPGFTLREGGGEFQNPPGRTTYACKWGGINTKDAQGRPALKYFGDRPPAAFASLLVVDGEHKDEAVPLALRPDDGDLDYWARAFTGAGYDGDDLAQFDQLLARGGKAINVATKKDGWARGVHVPKNTYVARFHQFTSRDAEGNATWIEFTSDRSRDGKVKKLLGSFSVAIGPYDGLDVPFSMTYQVTYKPDPDDPEAIGEYGLSTKAFMFQWCDAMGGDFLELGEARFANPYNIAPELEKHLQAKNKLVNIQVNDDGWVQGEGAVTPVSDDVAEMFAERLGRQQQQPAPAATVAVAQPVPEPAAEAVPATNGTAESPGTNGTTGTNGQVSGNADLLAALGEVAVARGVAEPIQGPDKRLTPAGMAVAKDVLGPLCDSAGVPRSFQSMSEAQRHQMAAALRGTIGDQALAVAADEF